MDSDTNDEKRLLSPRPPRTDVGATEQEVYCALSSHNSTWGRLGFPIRGSVFFFSVPVEFLFQALSEHHRKLRLIWNPPAVGATPREARAASWLVRDLAHRIGMVPRGDPVPRAIRQQRWSPLNLPLMWAAAGEEASHPLLEWLENAARRVQELLEFHGGPNHGRGGSQRGMERFESGHANMADHFTGAVDRVDGSAGITKSFCSEPHRCQGPGVHLEGGGHGRCQSGSAGSRIHDGDHL